MTVAADWQMASKLELDFSPIHPVEVVAWRKSLETRVPASSHPCSHRTPWPSRDELAGRIGIDRDTIWRWEAEGPRPPWTALLRERWEHGDPITPVDATVEELDAVVEHMCGGSIGVFLDEVPVGRRTYFYWREVGVVSGYYGWGRLIRNLARDLGVTP